MLYGLVVLVPIDVAPAKNCTWLTVPSESLAVADTVIGEPGANVAPLAGAVRLTVGALFTVIVTGADVVVAPRLSVATAVSVKLPPEAGVQLMLYGLVEAVPIA